jgi:hypothetical protein
MVATFAGIVFCATLFVFHGRLSVPPSPHSARIALSDIPAGTSPRQGTERSTGSIPIGSDEVAGLRETEASKIPSEVLLLPLTSTTQEIVHKEFSPHYTGEAATLIPEKLRGTLEKVVDEDLHWMVAADADAFDKQQSLVSKLWYGVELSYSYSKKYPDAFREITRTAHPGAIERIGFKDIPFRVFEAKLIDVMPNAAGTTNEAMQKALPKLYTFVEVSLVQKEVGQEPSPMYGAMIRTYVLVADDHDGESVFVPLQSFHRELLSPAVDVPLFIHSGRLPEPDVGAE